VPRFRKKFYDAAKAAKAEEVAKAEVVTAPAPAELLKLELDALDKRARDGASSMRQYRRFAASLARARSNMWGAYEPHGIIGYSLVRSKLRLVYWSRRTAKMLGASKTPAVLSKGIRDVRRVVVVVPTSDVPLRRAIVEYFASLSFGHVTIRGSRTTWWWRPGFDPVELKVSLPWVPITQKAVAL